MNENEKINIIDYNEIKSPWIPESGTVIANLPNELYHKTGTECGFYGHSLLGYLQRSYEYFDYKINEHEDLESMAIEKGAALHRLMEALIKKEDIKDLIVICINVQGSNFQLACFFVPFARIADVLFLTSWPNLEYLDCHWLVPLTSFDRCSI